MAARDRILDDAWKVLAREGQVSPALVAREASVSKALVFHHFKDLRGLRDAMAERVLRQTQAGLDALAAEAPNPRERIEALTRALLSLPPDPPGPTRRVMRFWLDEGDAGRARDALVIDFIEKTLKPLRFHSDPRELATMLLARWHGATAVYANGGTVDFERETERTLAEIERTLTRT